MRDTKLDIQGFVGSIEHYYDSEVLQVKSAELLSRITPNDEYNFRFTNRLGFKTRKLDDFLFLAISSWYLPEEIGCLLRLELSEIFSENPDIQVFELLLRSKAEMLIFLEESNLWHTRDFFGNLLTRERREKLFHLFFPIFVPIKPNVKRVQRHRGYRDKGSLRFSHEVHEAWSGTREQQTIEYNRLAQSETIALLAGFLYG
jgi:hypothetical protein